MRLIDADALIEEIVKIPDMRRLSTKTIGEAIRRVPTIEPKKGKWIKISPAKIYECSECGMVFLEWMSGFRFCPNCGARMESE